MSGRLLEESPKYPRASTPFEEVMAFEVKTSPDFNVQSQIRRFKAEQTRTREFIGFDKGVFEAKGVHHLQSDKVYPVKIFAINPHWLLDLEDTVEKYVQEAALLVGGEGLSMIAQYYRHLLPKGYDYLSMTRVENLPQTQLMSQVPGLRACSYQFKPEYIFSLVSRRRGFDNDQRLILFYPPKD